MSVNPAIRTAGLFLVAIGCVVLTGWALQIEALKALLGPITMKANAAAGLLAAGFSLQALGASRRGFARAGRGGAIIVCALGAATLSQHLVGWDLGIDQLLFDEAPGAAATVSPGRMGPNAATCLTLAGLALTCLYRGSARAVTVAQVLAAGVVTLALIPIVGYIYGATELYAVARYTGIGIHTGISLLVLGVAILGARPAAGPVAALLTELPHGVMARRLLVIAVAVPFVLGYARVFGERRGWYDVGLGAAMFVVAMIVLLSLTIWRTALALGRTAADLQRAEQQRGELLTRERAARQKAERADRAKDEFIAALSHELRTPLNAILGWMYMLRNDTVPEAARGKAAEVVVRNAGLLARLIEDLLDTSRIATGHLTLAQAAVDLRAVVQAAIESVLPASDGKKVTVERDDAADLPLVTGDAQRLQQVVWNLLSNAIKFSPPGGRVQVMLLAEGGAAVVRVRDEGRGIEPAFLPHVFDRFQQADSSASRLEGGLGLGLYIAHHLTALHGGSLEAHSDGAGTGAVFTMRIPAGAHLPPAPSQTSPVPMVSDRG